MALLNQRFFSPQSLSCSYHRLTSMQMGLVVIFSISISHNFGLEGPITTSQAFFVYLVMSSFTWHTEIKIVFPLKVSRVRIIAFIQ